MTIPEDYSFTRYLAAKKSVDDRALNHHVWQAVAARLAGIRPAGAPLRVLEAGSGIGTMLERMLEWGLFGSADYTGVDSVPENLDAGDHRLAEWASRLGFRLEARPRSHDWLLQRPGQRVQALWESANIFDFAARHRHTPGWDLLVAHAFLDLFDLSSALPVLFSLLRPGGIFYFTINFDGGTLLEPAIEPGLDDLIQFLYHKTMDERLTAGRASGDSRSGRHLFAHLKALDAQLFEAGSSDWVVFPQQGGYCQDEAYFLHFIIHIIEKALRGRPELDPLRFAGWVQARHNQVERGELVYIAHQLDFAGRLAG